MSNNGDRKYKYLEFEKLVRDKNPDTIFASGGEANFKIISGDEKIRLLKEKLVEEANEVLDAKDDDEVVAEIGDVIDVLQQIVKDLKIKKRLIRKSRRLKLKHRGKFKKGIYMYYVKFPAEVNENWMHKYKDITDKIEKSRNKEKQS